MKVSFCSSYCFLSLRNFCIWMCTYWHRRRAAPRFNVPLQAKFISKSQCNESCYMLSTGNSVTKILHPFQASHKLDGSTTGSENILVLLVTKELKHFWPARSLERKAVAPSLRKAHSDSPRLMFCVLQSRQCCILLSFRRFLASIAPNSGGRARQDREWAF